MFVDELRTSDRKGWPLGAEASGTSDEHSYDRRTNKRKILGAREYINYEGFPRGNIASHDTIKLSTGVRVNWFLVVWQKA